MTPTNLAMPHFLLFAESNVFPAPRREGRSSGAWRFRLESVDGKQRVSAADHESRLSSERLQLLSIIRGLEALNQPSRVTLITSSRYVVHGIRFGLDQWRTNNWQWEDFGRMSQVSNADMWERLNRALEIHEVDCRVWRLDPPAKSVPAPLGLRRKRQRRSHASLGCSPSVEPRAPTVAASSPPQSSSPICWRWQRWLTRLFRQNPIEYLRSERVFQAA